MKTKLCFVDDISICLIPFRTNMMEDSLFFDTLAASVCFKALGGKFRGIVYRLKPREVLCFFSPPLIREFTMQQILVPDFIARDYLIYVNVHLRVTDQAILYQLANQIIFNYPHISALQ